MYVLLLLPLGADHNNQRNAFLAGVVSYEPSSRFGCYHMFLQSPLFYDCPGRAGCNKISIKINLKQIWDLVQLMS